MKPEVPPAASSPIEAKDQLLEYFNDDVDAMNKAVEERYQYLLEALLEENRKDEEVNRYIHKESIKQLAWDYMPDEEKLLDYFSTC